MKLAMAAMLVSAALAAAADTAALPAPARAEHPRLKPFSQARFTKFLFHVYDARLWVEGERWSPENVFALDLRYAMTIRGRDLAERSIEEILRQGPRDARQLERWRASMARVFPDIAPGDRLVGVSFGGREARFYDGGRLIGTVEDPEFTRAFFDIWLGERTSEPALRRALLRLSE